MTARWAALACCIVAASVISFALMGVDKRRARRGGRRVRERTLWLWAILGGGPGAFLGMRAFHHKTRRLRFAVGFPLLAALDMVLLAGLCPMWVW